MSTDTSAIGYGGTSAKPYKPSDMNPSLSSVDFTEDFNELYKTTFKLNYLLLSVYAILTVLLTHLISLATTPIEAIMYTGFIGYLVVLVTISRKVQLDLYLPTVDKVTRLLAISLLVDDGWSIVYADDAKRYYFYRRVDDIVCDINPILNSDEQKFIDKILKIRLKANISNKKLYILDSDKDNQ